VQAALLGELLSQLAETTRRRVCAREPAQLERGDGVVEATAVFVGPAEDDGGRRASAGRCGLHESCSCVRRRQVELPGAEELAGWPSNTRPCCMSSENSTEHPASRAAAMIRLSNQPIVSDCQRSQARVSTAKSRTRTSPASALIAPRRAATSGFDIATLRLSTELASLKT